MTTPYFHPISTTNLTTHSHYDAQKVTAQPKTCHRVNSADSIQTACMIYGPLTVGISVSPSMQLYQSGIYDGPCGSDINHTMLLVGYAPEYWILKNTWGTSWGEHGYIRIKRGLCGISDSVYFSKF